MNPGAVLAKRYEIMRTIGSGGMGDVYQARRLPDGAFVAIKVLREEMVKDKEAVARFRREARAAAALRSPHAARIFDVGEAETKQPFIVMEYLEGWDLMSEIDARGALPMGEAVGYVAQACHAMIEAHDLGIVHRDLKPPNLFLAREGNARVVKVLDFGISKVTALSDGHVTSTQMSFGSPLYMSPEQIRSTKLVDARSDVWSLGVILYEALTGEPPFMGETAGALAVVISVEAHIPPSQKRNLPPGIDDVIAGALQKDPKKRYQSVKEFLRALEDYLPGEEVSKSHTLIDPPKDAKIPGRRFTPQMNPNGAPAARPGPAPPGAYGPGGAGYQAGQQQQQQQMAHAPIAHAVTSNPQAPDDGSQRGGPRTMVMPPRITLGPATTDPPVSLGQKKERIGLIVAAIMIPLGALAFGFAIWLYAKRAPDTRDRPRSTAVTAEEDATSTPAGSPTTNVTPQITPTASASSAPSAGTSTTAAATTTATDDSSPSSTTTTRRKKKPPPRPGPLLPERP